MSFAFNSSLKRGYRDLKIGIVLGTRPEIIKFFPIIRLLENLSLSYFIIHTHQHYDKNMDADFFEELEIPKPKYNLNIGSHTHGKMTGLMLMEIESILLEEKPTIVLVQGDTNTTLAGALAASKIHVQIGHVEAGLRSYDKTMPEEINRIIVDHISDFLFVPNKNQTNILRKEGIDKSKIFVTGNTIVDAVYLAQQLLLNKT